MKTVERESEVSRQRDPHTKSNKLQRGAGSSNGEEERHATSHPHREEQERSSSRHQEGAIKGILKNSKPTAMPQSTKPRMWPAERNQRQYTRFSQQEKAKGVLHTPDLPQLASPDS